MKLLRIIILAFFIITSVIYGVNFVREKVDQDNIAPEISAESDEIYVSVEATDEELLQGLTAYDDKDGDVTNSLVVVSQMDFITKGTRKINYAAFDSHNNVGTYNRKIVYTDYRSPHFSSTRPFHFVYSDDDSSSTVFSQVMAEDVLDGDLTASIRIVYGSASESGTVYPVVMSVTNSAGDTASISVNAYREDTTSFAIPSPALSNYIVYTTVNEWIDPEDYVIGYYRNGVRTVFNDDSRYTFEDVTWDDSGVDYSTPGEYVITYRLYGNEMEGELGQTELYVIVEE